jgi:hypothetical protein
VADAHDTAFRTVLVAPLIPGNGCNDQDAPFHRSAAGARPPLLLAKEPTATHHLADAQDTPASTERVAPGGSGTLIGFQAAPFHASASAEVPTPLAYDPTATHQSGPAQESPDRAPLAIRAPGVGWMDQAGAATRGPAAAAGASGPASPIATAMAPGRTATPRRRARRSGKRQGQTPIVITHSWRTSNADSCWHITDGRAFPAAKGLSGQFARAGSD